MAAPEAVAEPLLSLLDLAEPAIVLVGLPLAASSDGPDERCTVLVGVSSEYEVSAGVRPFFDLLATPQPESVVRKWLADDGSPSTALDQLAAAGRVVIVAPGTPAETIAQLEGWRLYSVGDVIDWKATDPLRSESIALIGDVQFPQLAVPVSTVLIDAAQRGGVDLPRALELVAEAQDRPHDDVVLDALTWLPVLLASGFGFIGPVGD